MYKDWCGRFPIISLEDPFDRKDWESFFRLKSALEDGGEGSGEDEDGEAAAAAEGGEGGEEGGAAAAVRKLEPVGGDEQCMVQIVGDELIVGAADITKATDEHQINTMTLELGKRPSVTENIATCSQVQEQGWGVIVSARAGETDDTFAADFAIGMQAGQFKAGGLNSAGSIAKYNQLLRVASGADAPRYAGPNFRKQDSVA